MVVYNVQVASSGVATVNLPAPSVPLHGNGAKNIMSNCCIRSPFSPLVCLLPLHLHGANNITLVGLIDFPSYFGSEVLKTWLA